MNIYHFESTINKIILERGYTYYVNGNIVEVHQASGNEYFFHIEGTEDYEVFVEMGDNGEIIYSECDCPYDLGPVCKHKVAAYYHLLEMMKQKSHVKKIDNKKNKRPTIQEVLNNLSKEELIKIILEITDNDTTFEKTLLYKYSKGDNQDELKACQNLIHSIAKKYKGREGFIKYRNTSNFVRELESISEKARNTEHVLLALDIALLLLKEAMGAFQYVDDSSGNIGWLVKETLELIEELVSEHHETEHYKTEIFEKLLNHSDKHYFDDWIDFKLDLLSICFEFADDEKLRDKLRGKIETMLVNSNDWSSKYENERLLNLLYQLIEEYGTPEETEQFVHDHLQFTSFREKLLNKYLDEENYGKVIELAQEGEKQDRQYLGLVFEWKKYRYKAYKGMSLKEEQINLAKELLIGGDFEYYQELKALYSENQEEFYRSFKQELKVREGWQSSRILLKIIEEENDLEELLAFVQKEPLYIEDYAEKLVGQFQEEVEELYREFIRKSAMASNNRSAYRKVCQQLKKYKKIVGKPKQLELINELIDQYKKRPAFLDELENIK